MTFYLTFGSGQTQDSVVREGWHNGWVEVEARGYEEARAVVHELFGRRWSMLYDVDRFDPSFFPRGCVLRVSVLQGQLATQ